jgi:hypothetical protein
MPSLGFSGANLATVAYAEVSADGTSLKANSGVATTLMSTGVYHVILPTNLGQTEGADLTFCQQKSQDGSGPSLVPSNIVVDDTDTLTKVVHVTVGVSGSPANQAFSILILRSTITPPSGAPY